jgi:hypothetical protein
MGAWARHSWGIFKWSKPDELRRKKAHKRRAFNHHYFIIFIKHRILNSSCLWRRANLWSQEQNGDRCAHAAAPQTAQLELTLANV